MRLVRILTLMTFVVCGVVCFAPIAGAARKQLWYNPRVDAVASDVAGTSVRVDGEDDWTEWAGFVAPDDPYAVLGFTFPFAPSSSVLYHRIFISPSLWTTLDSAVDDGVQSGAPYDVAVAIMDMTHEAFHIRLVSGDEGRVNACALQAFPGVLTRDFGVPATDVQTTTVPVETRVRVKVRVKVGGHWAVRYHWKTKTSYQTSTTTVPNATYTTLVSDAQAFYNSQPSPYSTGTCW
jgi:hypothetical protein